MVTQCDWSWYLDVGLSLITFYNKSTKTAVYQYDSAPCIQQRRHITHTDWLCIVGRDYNKNQNFYGDESISREIGSTHKPNLVKLGQRNNQSREIGSTQKRGLVKYKNEISWNQVNIVKLGQLKNHISWNRVNTKTKSMDIGSTQKRNLVKSGEHKSEISWNHVNARFSIHYTIC